MQLYAWDPEKTSSSSEPYEHSSESLQKTLVLPSLLLQGLEQDTVSDGCQTVNVPYGKKCLSPRQS